MKMIKLFLVIFLIITSLKWLSQTDFRPGSYISLKNDTVHGLIDYRGDIRNAKFCVFKKDENSKPVKYAPGKIKAYRYTDSKYYISKIVKTKDDEKQVFVEYLVNGIADLFYYRDMQVNGNHYFIETEHGELFELKNEKDTIFIEGKGKFLRETNRHIGLLKVAFADCMEIQPQIDKIELNHKSLINIAKNYHDYVCEEDKCIIYEKKYLQ